MKRTTALQRIAARVWTSMFLAAAVLATTAAAAPAREARAADDGEEHFLYVTVPDGAGGSGRGPAIYVFDIEDGHRFVKRIDVPEMRGTRGCCASAQAGKLYISHGNTSLLCWDILSEKVVWRVTYPKEDGGADRCSVTLDGKVIRVGDQFGIGRVGIGTGPINQPAGTATDCSDFGLN
jgi:hypothetical protein